MSQYPVKDASSPRGLPKGCVGGGLIASVAIGSPAWDVGFEPGCCIVSADGFILRDVIDWRWIADGESVTVGYVDLAGDAGEVELWRDPGQDWGIEFDNLVFDGVRQCRNACTFCFMRMLPEGMRPSLYVRDDDYRLSFLVGTFVTLTNVTAADERRIIEQRISPLRVSLQVANPHVRRAMIGKHAAHGLEVLERLLAAGIEFHAQVVLVPDCNDGDVLRDTLAWAYARPGILSVGVVPLGYTRFQNTFEKSFNDREASRAVLSSLAVFQARAQAERGCAWAYAADEFYRNAYGPSLLRELPPASFYGDFSMFEDGVGIIRSTVDDWREAHGAGSIARCAEALRATGTVVYMVVGLAQRDFLDPLVAESCIGDVFVPLYVDNSFFGGNVDVTGLLVGKDISAAARRVSDRAIVAVPRVVLNDEGVTLDDMTLADMEKAAGRSLRMVSCSPIWYFDEIADGLR